MIGLDDREYRGRKSVPSRAGPRVSGAPGCHPQTSDALTDAAARSTGWLRSAPWLGPDQPPYWLQTSSDQSASSAPVPRPVEPLKALSLFSNCGAGDTGFAASGFQFSIMAELVQSRLTVALRNHPGALGVVGDLRKTWPDVVGEWRHRHGAAEPALLAACPPCQGMSTARSDRGHESDPEAGSKDPRNVLVLPIAHIALKLSPTFVVVENVTAFLRRLVRHPESGEALSASKLLIRLLADTYDAYPFLTNLADFGVPQTRKRSFLTFVRRSSAAATLLRKHRNAPYPVPVFAADCGGSPISLRSALAAFRLPPLDASPSATAEDETHPLHFVPRWPLRQYRMVAAIPPGSGASAWENDHCEACGPTNTRDHSVLCPRCKNRLLRPIVNENGHLRLVRGFRRSSYRRMDPSTPAATITTASGRIGASRTLHPFENRVLSPLECALLQTIPPCFDWTGALEERGVTEVRAMIGEAVPPFFTNQHGAVLASLSAGRTPPSILSTADPRCERAARQLGL